MNINQTTLFASPATESLETPLAPCTIKEMPAEERPRERLLRHGAGHLTDAELLGILLGSGIRGASAVELGRQLVRRYGTLRGLARPAAMEIAAHRGIGAARAARLCASLELARRAAAEPLAPRARIDGPAAVHRHFGPLLADLPRERLYVVLLDRRQRVLREVLVAEGTVGEACVAPREVFHAAIAERASGVIAIHNHPSGDPTPSEQDYAVTARLAACGRLLDIPLHDHVIVTRDRYESISERLGGRFEDLARPSVLDIPVPAR